MPWRGSDLDGNEGTGWFRLWLQWLLTMSCPEAEGGYGSTGGELWEQRGLEAGMGWLGLQVDLGETFSTGGWKTVLVFIRDCMGERDLESGLPSQGGAKKVLPKCVFPNSSCALELRENKWSWVHCPGPSLTSNLLPLFLPSSLPFLRSTECSRVLSSTPTHSTPLTWVVHLLRVS